MLFVSVSIGPSQVLTQLIMSPLIAVFRDSITFMTLLRDSVISCHAILGDSVTFKQVLKSRDGLKRLKTKQRCEIV